MRKMLASLALAATLAAPATVLPADAFAQPRGEQDGLVNVFAADLIDIENVNVNVVAQVLAAVCPGITADVAALASQVDQSGDPVTVDCPVTGDEITISQNNRRNNPGGGPPGSPPGRVSQDGLVNVFAADLVEARDINVNAVAQVLASVCPGITADVAALATQVDQTGDPVTVNCPVTGAPIEITQNNPGRGQ